MNSISKCTLTLLLLCSALLVNAQTSNGQQAIAVIDIESAIANSAYATSELKKLQQKETFKKNFEVYTRLRNEIKTLQEEAKTNSLTWSQAQKQDYQSKIEEKLAEINNVGSLLDKEKETVERQIQKFLMPQIEKIVPEIIKEKNLGLLLNARAVYFKTPGFDLTLELVKRLDQQ